MKQLQIVLITLCALGSLARAQDSAVQPAPSSASQPAIDSAAPNSNKREEQAQVGLAEFVKNHIFIYEPIYFIAGGPSTSSMVKFQFSFRYQPFTIPEDRASSFLNQVNFGYSQTSLWDITAESSPFHDSSYRPELFLFKERDVSWPMRITNVLYQGGFKHESNGKAEPESRSMNILYAQVAARFGSPGELNLQVSPRVWTYLGDMDDNPDIYQYRGYGDLQAKLTFPNELMVAATGRMGNDFDKGMIQVDVSYPLHRMTHFDAYLYGQYFNGFGESLVEYDESSQALRIGLAIVR